MKKKNKKREIKFPLYFYITYIIFDNFSAISGTS